MFARVWAQLKDGLVHNRKYWIISLTWPYINLSCLPEFRQSVGRCQFCCVKYCLSLMIEFYWRIIYILAPKYIFTVFYWKSQNPIILFSMRDFIILSKYVCSVFMLSNLMHSQIYITNIEFKYFMSTFFTLCQNIYIFAMLE